MKIGLRACVSVLMLLVLWDEVACYPSGAPARACSTMMPIHSNLSPQDSVSPFLVTVTPELGGPVKVTLEDPNGKLAFKGFLLRASNSRDGTFINRGTFSQTEDATALNCEDISGNALTHNSPREKLKIVTFWTPPANFNGEVVFRATVVEKYDTFWGPIQSKAVAVRSTRMLPKSPPVTASPQTLNVYSHCGSSKGCFGLPGNCVEKENCQIVVSFLVVNGTVRFELTGALGHDSGWIAVALSDDSKMGDDTVTECIYFSGETNVRESWNINKSRKNNIILPEESETTHNKKGVYEDGILTCEWSRPISTVVNGHIFDLRNKELHILLSKGSTDNHGNKLIHSVQLASAYPVNLTSIQLVVGKTSTLLKIHGSLMTTTWMCLVSIGILLARHYKEVWMKYKLCNTKVWFAAHRCFMLLGVILVIAAFIAIFIHVEGWSEIGNNPHSIVGCVVTGLAILQPIIALCRPEPTLPKRSVFNWVHMLIGNGAQVTAVVNMFFAVSLRSSNLPQAFYWVMVTFIIFHCLVHLLIHIHSCFMERERERESNVKLDQFQYGDGYNINAPGSAFKKFALGLYTLVNVGLTSALVLMICLN